MDLVVPFTLERVAVDVECSKLIVGDFTALGILALIQPGMDLQSLCCVSGTDQIDNDLVSLQGDALPVAGDVAEQPMFDLVPFARARREMADLHDQARAIGKALQFRLPKSVSMTIAAPTVSGNQQTLGRPVTFGSSGNFGEVMWGLAASFNPFSVKELP